MIDTVLIIVETVLQILWWVVPVIALTMLAIWINDRAEQKQRGDWPYDFDPPPNMDEESA